MGYRGTAHGRVDLLPREAENLRTQRLGNARGGG
jgi:hypothetical protein